ncbi:hypothetical protein HYU20_03695 [Candidatus Woesearchaeota archaeon]|nr:hypothetical protein [Candidatus Woesearchaeota archaeon]
MKVNYLKEKLIGASGSLSGITSFLGSYQVCHNLCMSTIALLSIVGITLAGMPLLFLTKVAVPFWTAAVALMLLTIFLYLKKRCVSEKLIIFNSGLIVAGVPFQPLQQFSLIFWTTGGALVALSAILLIKDKLAGKTKAGAAKAKLGGKK